MKIIQFWLLLILVFNSCVNKEKDVYDSFDYIAFSKATVKNDSLDKLLVKYPSGKYYYLSESCNSCLDLELARIEGLNSMGHEIIVISSNEELVQRISEFLKLTKALEIDRELNEGSILIVKNENAMKLISLEKFFDEEKN